MTNLSLEVRNDALGLLDALVGGSVGADGAGCVQMVLLQFLREYDPVVMPLSCHLSSPSLLYYPSKQSL